MIPFSFHWNTQKRSILLKWDGFFSLGWNRGNALVRIFGFSEGEVSIISLRRMPAMIESFFGKIPDLMEKAVNIVKRKKKGEAPEGQK